MIGLNVESFLTSGTKTRLINCSQAHKGRQSKTLTMCKLIKLVHICAHTHFSFTFILFLAKNINPRLKTSCHLYLLHSHA